MGNTKSEEEKMKEDYDACYQNPRYISWDEHGNLVYGMIHPVSRRRQLEAIMKLDKELEETTGKEWYIMDSAWVASWLAYAHGDIRNAPAPGPCRNNRLIAWDYQEHKYKGRYGLFMAIKDRAGDYRRVSKEVWEQFQAFYPGSGPSISMIFDPTQLGKFGEYDTESFTIHDPPAPPEDSENTKKKKKFGLSLGKGAKDEASEEEKRDHPDSEPVDIVPAPLTISEVIISQGQDSDDDDDAAFAARGKSAPQPPQPKTPQQPMPVPTQQSSKAAPKPVVAGADSDDDVRDSDDDDDMQDRLRNNNNNLRSISLVSDHRQSNMDYSAVPANQGLQSMQTRTVSTASDTSTTSATRKEMFSNLYTKD